MPEHPGVETTVGELHAHRATLGDAGGVAQDAAALVAGDGIAARQHGLRREVLEVGGEGLEALAAGLEQARGRTREALAEHVDARGERLRAWRSGAQAEPGAGGAQVGGFEPARGGVAQAFAQACEGVALAAQALARMHQAQRGAVEALGELAEAALDGAALRAAAEKPRSPFRPWRTLSPSR